MADPGLPLHTGTHAGIWGTVEVALAVAVLVGSVAFLAALLRNAREGTPEARLAAAFASEEQSTEATSEGGRRPSERRGD